MYVNYISIKLEEKQRNLNYREQIMCQLKESNDGRIKSY